MSNPKDTSDWLETQVKKIVREELANGCRCNNADGTRSTSGPLWDLDASKRPNAESDASKASVSGIKTQSEGYIAGMKSAAEKSRLGIDAGSELVERVPHSCVNSLVQGDLFLVGGAFSFADCECKQLTFNVCLDFVERLACGCCHCSSPVRSEPSAGHTCSSALTVQEGGDGTAVASGVGDASSPASSTPRFVAVGEYVYDRELNLVTGGWPGAVAAAYALDLNADTNVAGYMNWEDAK